MITRILVARHAETLWNSERRLQGRMDSPLTALGVEQAQALAKAWYQEGLSDLIASTLGRAVATATIVGEHVRCGWQTDERLVEQHYGELEGMPLSEVANHYPSLVGIFDGIDQDAVPPGGESLRQSAWRLYKALQTMPQRYENETIGVITHGHVLQGLVWLLHGAPEGGSFPYKHANGAFSEFHLDNNVLQLRQWGIDPALPKS